MAACLTCSDFRTCASLVGTVPPPASGVSCYPYSWNITVQLAVQHITLEHCQPTVVDPSVASYRIKVNATIIYTRPSPPSPPPLR